MECDIAVWVKQLLRDKCWENDETGKRLHPAQVTSDMIRFTCIFLCEPLSLRQLSSGATLGPFVLHDNDYSATL